MASTTIKLVEEFLQRYCEAFRAGNATAAAAFYHAPAAMIFDDRLVVLDSHAKLAAVLDRILTGLIERGFSRSIIDRMEVMPLTDNTALINAAFSRLRADGTVLERLGATYTVIGGDSGLRIACVVTHDPNRAISAA